MKFYLLPKTCPFCQDSYYLISPSSHICQSIHSSCPSVNNVLMALPIFKVSHFYCFVGGAAQLIGSWCGDFVI
ncbi:hypothetical protein EmuJ_001088100 [Echinococcus multilocularis]|uniref:Uncharacterized protein n=1 Tax=Echinococcus multilocularis TaxID=6211 RepID=A0A068YIN5_ECHMU|nr:hypothetical protein EmuJ_001088100 [Echinococcus multilocularis]